MDIVEIKELDVLYGHVYALKRLTLKFNGDFLVVLGPNGAGKTTLLTTLIGLVKPYRGLCRVLGKACEEMFIEGFNDVAFSFEKPPNIRLSIESVYDLLCRFRDCDWELLFDLLETFDLKPNIVLRRSFSRLSAGERMKAYLSMVLSLPSRLYLLDEPNANLDPASRVRLREILERAAVKAPLIVTTHIYEYVEDLATHIAVLYKGSLIYYGTVEDAINKYAKNTCLVKVKLSRLERIRNLLKQCNIVFEEVGPGLLMVKDCETVLEKLKYIDGILSISFGSLEVIYNALLEGERHG